MSTQQEELKGINQWENQLYAEVSNPATFERLWNSIPEATRDCIVYDWPENETP